MLMACLAHAELEPGDVRVSPRPLDPFGDVRDRR